MEDKEKERDSFLKKAILGFFIGLAVIVPGISGSTIAIIFKLYKKILYAIAHFIKEFKYSVMFLSPIIVGAVIGVFVGFFTVQKLIDLIPFAIISLFGGLMLGAIPSLKDEVKGVEVKKYHIAFIVLGIIIPLIMTIIPILIALNSDIQENRLTINFPSFCVYLVLGFLVAATQFIPGCSATATLMALGYFMPIMRSLTLSYITNNPMILVVYLFLIIGFVVGCAVLGKLLNHLIERFKNIMYFLFIGLSLGSIICLFLNSDMLLLYQGWAKSATFPFLDVFLGVGLFIVGTIIAYELVLFMRRKGSKE